MSSNFVCTHTCYIKRLWRPGDVTSDESVVERGKDKFSRLASKQDAKMKAEIAELVPEIAERDNSRIKPISNLDLAQAGAMPIGGDKF